MNLQMSLISSSTPFDLDLGLRDTHVLVTGGSGYIGKVVVHAFLAAGCNVTIVDVSGHCPFNQNDEKVLFKHGDITKSDQMDEIFAEAEQHFGPIETCIALASLDLSVLPQSESLADVDPKVWQRVFDVNVTGTFMTCQKWLRSIRNAAGDPEKAAKLKNASLVIMGSESGRFGVRTMAAYAAGKSAVQYGLMYSLAQDALRVHAKARVNAIAPGAVETELFHKEVAELGREYYYGECEATVPLARPVPPEHVARTILFLASERYSGSVHGQVLPIDGGKTGSLVWSLGESKEKRP